MNNMKKLHCHTNEQCEHKLNMVKQITPKKINTHIHHDNWTVALLNTSQRLPFRTQLQVTSGNKPGLTILFTRWRSGRILPALRKKGPIQEALPGLHIRSHKKRVQVHTRFTRYIFLVRFFRSRKRFIGSCFVALYFDENKNWSPKICIRPKFAIHHYLMWITSTHVWIKYDLLTPM